MKLCTSLLFAAQIVLASAAWGQAPSSVVGNGGNLFREYLNTTRLQFVAVLRAIDKLHKDGGNLAFLCAGRGLSAEQLNYCRKFALAAIPQMLDLNTVEPRTPLEPGEDLMAPDSRGELAPCDAKVERIEGQPVDRMSPIRFETRRARLYSPQELLFLMAHEFGHMIQYEVDNPRLFIDDYVAVGPFTDGGKTLLDAVASTIMGFAVDRGLVGQNFTLVDLFQCSAKMAGMPFESQFSIPARRLPSENGPWQQRYDKYTAGFGLPGPASFGVSFMDTALNKQLYLRMQIVEQHACAPLSNPTTLDRSTRLSLVYLDDHPTNYVTVVESTGALPRNPICEAEQIPILLQYRGMTFSCTFAGTRGTTSLSGADQ